MVVIDVAYEDVNPRGTKSTSKQKGKKEKREPVKTKELEPAKTPGKKKEETRKHPFLTARSPVFMVILARRTVPFCHFLLFPHFRLDIFVPPANFPCSSSLMFMRTIGVCPDKVIDGTKCFDELRICLQVIR